MKQKRVFGALALSGMATAFLSVGKTLQNGAAALPASHIFMILGFLALTKLWMTIWEACADRRLLRICMITGFLFSLCYCLGSAIQASIEVDYSSPWLYCNIVGMTVVFTAVLLWLFQALERKKQTEIRFAKLDRFWKAPTKKFFLYAFGIILLCYLPAYLAAYPGLFSFDGPLQALYYHDGVLDAHHPLLSTALLGIWIDIGHAVFGSYQGGLALYSLFQGACLAATFAYTLCFLRRYKAPKLLVFGSLVFFALNPFFQIFVFATIKEVLFGSALLLLGLFSLDLILQPDAFFKRPLLQIRYAVTALLMCLLRNQGIYILVVFIPFCVWACRVHRVRLTGLCLAVVALYGVWIGPISTAMGVYPAKIQEALCVPMQQVARVVLLYPERVTEEEKQTVYELIDPKAIENYEPFSADAVKAGFDKAVFEKDPQKYIQTYLSIGKKNAGIYLDSFLYGCYGYFYPGYEALYSFQPSAFYNAFDESMNVYDIHQAHLFPLYELYLRATIEKGWINHIPIVSLCADLAFPFWLMVFAAAYLFYKKRYRLMAPMVLWLGLWGTLLLGPVTLSRYAFPLIMALPALAMLLFTEYGPKSAEMAVCTEKNEGKALEKTEMEPDTEQENREETGI